jgi:hypothetical protein
MLTVVGTPPFLCWTWQEKYLPDVVYNKREFTASVKKLTAIAAANTTVRGGTLLAIGLLLREIECMEVICSDPDAFPVEGMPTWTIMSPLRPEWKKCLLTPMLAML